MPVNNNSYHNFNTPLVLTPNDFKAPSRITGQHLSHKPGKSSLQLYYHRLFKTTIHQHLRPHLFLSSDPPPGQVLACKHIISATRTQNHSLQYIPSLGTSMKGQTPAPVFRQLSTPLYSQSHPSLPSLCCMQFHLPNFPLLACILAKAPCSPSLTLNFPHFFSHPSLVYQLAYLNVRIIFLEISSEPKEPIYANTSFANNVQLEQWIIFYCEAYIIDNPQRLCM